MSAEVYYFSGTGNSLFTARKLSAMFVETIGIQPISRFNRQKMVETHADSIGIVFPVYFQTIPRIVKTFIDKLVFRAESPYIYAIATCNGSPGHSLFTLNRLLNRKGKALSAGFAITMPGNSLIIRDFTNPPEVRSRRLNDSKEKLNKIFEYVNNHHSGIIEGTDDFKHHFQGFITGTVAKYVYRTPTKLRAINNCTKCMSCIKICPMNNIKMDKEGPSWGNDCEQCLACFHWCPQKVIEIGKNTVGKPRYHHPEISINHMYR